MPTDVLLVTRPQPGCAALTLNRPQALNALSRALRQAIADAAQAPATAPDGRCWGSPARAAPSAPGLT